MEIANYYIKTLTNAAGNLGPILIFCLVGYFVFIKLPFSFLLKVNKDQKLKEGEPKKEISTPNLKELQDKIRLEQETYQERLNQAREEKERKQREHQSKQKESEKEKAKTKAKEKQKEKGPPKKSYEKLTLAEELFEFEAGQTFTKGELKKRYHELIKQNHPDKVASLGADFKKLAEKKTKEINSAYDQLKKKAA